MAQTATQQDDLSLTDMPVGEILRRTREHYNQSIQEIVHALRIRAEQIEAIEQSHLEALPGRVYAIGFVRSYSEHLGLDGDKMVELFKSQASKIAPAPELHFPIPASDSKVPPFWLMSLCILSVVGIMVFWFAGDDKQRAVVETIPPVPKEMQIVQETPQTSLAVGPEQQPASTNAESVIEEKPPEGIILNIRENSWVEIRDNNGKAMLSRVLKAGDQYYVPDRPDLTISIGNAGGVEIEVDGQALRPLGQKGKVVRRLPLDTEYLKENFALETAR